MPLQSCLLIRDRLPFWLLMVLACASPVAVSPLAGQEPNAGPSPVDRDSTLELVSDLLGMADGPAYDGNALIIPDVKGQALFRWREGAEAPRKLATASARISATFFNHDRLWLADNQAGRIAVLDGNKFRTVVDFSDWQPPLKKQQTQRPYRPNDLVVDRQGGMYVTFTPQGQVVYVDPDGAPTVVIDDIETPNGITLSPDESTLYVSSFVPKKIFAYSLTAPGSVGSGNWFADLDEGPERGADGMAIDRAGNVYCAGPSDIWIWNPQGKLLDRISCPTKPINCTFGDRNRRTLYITGPGGIYRQAMKISGVTPQSGVVDLKPALQTPRKQPANQPSTDLDDYRIGKVLLDEVYASSGGRKRLMDVFLPAKPTGPTPCLLVVHGGGWHQGDKKKFRAMALKLCSQGYVTASVEYRLADEAPFPAAVEDCLTAVRFLRKHATRLGIDPDRIGAVGGSAGGHLVGLMATASHNPALQGTEHAGLNSSISAAVVLAGPLQIASGPVAEKSLDNSKFSNARSWLRGNVEQQPDLYRLADAYLQIDANTCPILFQVGELDQPQRNALTREKLQQLGIRTDLKVYDDGKHGCWNRQPWLDQMTADMDPFFRQTWR